MRPVVRARAGGQRRPLALVPKESSDARRADRVRRNLRVEEARLVATVIAARAARVCRNGARRCGLRAAPPLKTCATVALDDAAERDGRAGRCVSVGHVLERIPARGAEIIPSTTVPHAPNRRVVRDAPRQVDGDAVLVRLRAKGAQVELALQRPRGHADHGVVVRRGDLGACVESCVDRELLCEGEGAKDERGARDIRPVRLVR